jgi:hypothetical protein
MGKVDESHGEQIEKQNEREFQMEINSLSAGSSLLLPSLKLSRFATSAFVHIFYWFFIQKLSCQTEARPERNEDKKHMAGA